MQQEEHRADFVISWIDPPMTTAGWQMSILPANESGKARLEATKNAKGSHIMGYAASREAGLSAARAYIDALYP